MSVVPAGKDLLGAYNGRGTSRLASNISYPGIPNDESIVLAQWVEFLEPFASTNVYFPFYFRDATAQEAFFCYGTSSQFRVRSLHGGSIGEGDLVSVPWKARDVVLLSVLDRKNTKLELWRDGVRQAQNNITQDPDLSGGSLRLSLHTAGGAMDTGWVTWKAVLLSLKSGEMFTADEWHDIMHAIRDPGVDVEEFLEDYIGTVSSCWRPGEGVYGGSTITDEGKTGKDLTWSGVTFEDVRVRKRVPISRTKSTLYAHKPGYSATTGSVDFGLAVQPVVARIFFGQLKHKGSGQDCVRIRNAAGSHVAGLFDSATAPSLSTREPTTPWTNSPLDQQQIEGGDGWIVADGTSVIFYLCGQAIRSATLGEVLNFAGDCVVDFDGDYGDYCRIALWNPATVPATLLDEIRACVMNPEIDPPCLMTSRKVNFSLNSEKMPLGTETTVDNDWGPGTLTISAQRSTSCEPMITGYDP